MQPPQPIVVLTAASAACPSHSWDLHLTPVASSTDFWDREPPARCRAIISVFVMKPVSRGRVRLRTTDPADPPRVDHGFFSDAAGEDLRALADGCAIARDLASQEAAAPFVYGDKVTRLLEPDTTDLAAQLARYPLGYWHPTGTCRMGPQEDSGAVVDATGRVHGIDNLLVADASILPTIPRANPALTVLAVAERIAEEVRAA
jgi:choline dehydrogenase